ncbi:MAG: C-terminal binding protein [Dehalococcoidia bacterium]|nr:MAG: C-terminal binding protein [Dehalococcoidia bacterium]
MSYKVVMLVANPMIPHDEADYREIGVEFIPRPCQTEEEIIKAARDADFILTFKKPVTRKVIEQLERCRLIYNIGTGYETIDMEAATEHGICVSYPDAYCSEEVAEHAMALILACARKLVRLDRAVRDGKWESYEKREIRLNILPPMLPIRGKTLGLIGFGRIARKLVPKAKGFEMRVLALDPYVPASVFDEYGVEAVPLDYLIENSDFLSVHAAFTSDARHMLGAEQFQRMKPTAYVINCARGEFIDEAALYQALSRGEIAGAALDVIQEERMLPDHPLLKLDNVIITPHTAYYSEESLARMRRRPFEEIERMVNGQWPQWLLNSEVKKKFEQRWGKQSA